MADRPQAANLLRHHPELEEWLCTKWNQPIKDYRFYWDQEAPSTSVADHKLLPEHRLIRIHVSQKLCPADQLLALAFEIYNAHGHFSFDTVTAQAAAGKISREEYISEIDKREYGAALEVKKCFTKLLPLTSNEVATTTLYKMILEIPDEFQEYQAWCNRNHNRALSQEFYGRQFDELMKKQHAT